MSHQVLVWSKARCPICQQEYSYVEAYMPKTCNKFDCVQQYLHPELKRVRNGIKG